MKLFKTSIILFLLSTSPIFAQKNGVDTLQLKVSGICGMCKERIENAVDLKGVKFAEYDTKTHVCTIIYKTDKISEAEIVQSINEAGHDTDKSKASDEAYGKIHACCRYREDHDHE